MELGIRLIKIAALYMMGGLLLGVAMGISGRFALMSVHAHMLLLGWATMALAGTVYILMPACGDTRLAKLHFWGHNLALPVMMTSLALYGSGVKPAEAVLGFSSTLVLLSLALFTLNLFLNGRIERLKRPFAG